MALEHTVRELEKKIRREKERKENGPRPATVVLRQRLLEYIHAQFENARIKVREMLEARAKKEGKGTTRHGLLVLVDKETGNARRGAFVLRPQADLDEFPRGTSPDAETNEDKDLEQQKGQKRNVPRPRSLGDIIHSGISS